MQLLKPTGDLVFKTLLERNPELKLARSMLECLLTLPSPIRSLELLNREIGPDYPTDKPIVLDVRVCLDNHVRIDIEMQAQVVASTASRFLYYWARDFGQGLKRGDDYAKVVPITQVI